MQNYRLHCDFPHEPVNEPALQEVSVHGVVLVPQPTGVADVAVGLLPGDFREAGLELEGGHALARVLAHDGMGGAQPFKDALLLLGQCGAAARGVVFGYGFEVILPYLFYAGSLLGFAR